MTDKEFDRFLEDTIEAPPPAELSDEFTPWRSAMNRILWGTVWTTITLNSWYLDVILTATGHTMQLLGFRALRTENKWFRLGYGLCWSRVIWWILNFALHCTIYSGLPEVEQFLSIGAYGMLIPGFLLLLSLRNGIRTVQEKVGLPPHGGNGLLVCFCLMVFFATAQLGGLAVWGLMIVYVCILRNLFTLSGELDEAGYAVSPAPVRFSDSTVKRSCTAVILLTLVIGLCIFDSYRMDWQPFTPPQSEEVQAVRQELLELGFPEHILDDLTEEDILSCKGAKDIMVDVEDHPVNNGRYVTEQTAMGSHSYITYDQKELRITGIALELPGEPENWKIIHHFQWVIDPGFRGTEALHLWPAYRMTEGWSSCGSPTGQVLYTHAGESYAAPFHSLGHETYTHNTIFWGQQTSTDVFAEFSLPNRGENHRGYVSYTIAEVQDGWRIDTWINYTHQTPWPRYPVITAKEKQQTMGVGDTRTFKTLQDALQFLPGADEPIGHD